MEEMGCTARALCFGGGGKSLRCLPESHWDVYPWLNQVFWEWGSGYCGKQGEDFCFPKVGDLVRLRCLCFFVLSKNVRKIIFRLISVLGIEYLDK